MVPKFVSVVVVGLIDVVVVIGGLVGLLGLAVVVVVTSWAEKVVICDRLLLLKLLYSAGASV